MSLDRLKNLAVKIALFSKIGYILTVISIFIQSITLLWLTVMPNKFTSFFEKVRIYEPFVTDIHDAKLSLFELSVGIVAFLFLFVILRKTEAIFLGFSEEENILLLGSQLKNLSVLFLLESFFVPIIKTVSYIVFLREKAPFGIVDFSSLTLAIVLCFIAQWLQTKSVEE